MKIKITKSSVDKIKLTDKPIFYYDIDLIGFGIKANPTKAVYFAETRVKGKTVRKNIALVGVLTPEEARRQAKKQLGLMADGVDVNKEKKNNKKSNITLQEAYNDYISIKPLAKNTLDKYESALNNSFNDWRCKKIISINRDMIEARFNDISSRSKSIANADFRFLRALINYAMEKYSIDGEPLIPSNPCNRLSALKMWNKIDRRDTYIKPQQIPLLFKELINSENDRDILRNTKNQCLFLLFTGCRDQEAARLRWADINFQERVVTFLITKNHKKHMLPIGNWLFSFLLELSKGKNKEDFIFPGETAAGHLRYHRKTVKEVSIKSNVDFCLHDIRRTFASIINHHLGQSFTPYTIKRLLNHSQSDVTAGYIQFGIDDLRKPMQMIEDFILVSAGVKEAQEKPDNVVEFKKKKGA